MILVRELTVLAGCHRMDSSANEGEKPWGNRRERDQYFINKRANKSKNQNADQNRSWGPQQQWPPYHQQPLGPQTAYVPMMVYPAQPLGPSLYNQWNSGYQYMPPMPSMPGPYPAAYNSSWGQPASPMPNQQVPYNGNRTRQRAPPRQPPSGFMSEEDENAASSSNVGVGSLPKKPGTSQTPLETSEDAVASEGTPALAMAQRPKTATETIASKANQSPTMTERPKMLTDTVTSVPPQASKSTQRPRTSRIPVASAQRTSRIPVASASPRILAHHELYEPKEIAKPTLHTGSKEAAKQIARPNDLIVHVISDSPPSSISSSTPSLDMHVEPKEARKQADLQDEPILDNTPGPSSIRGSLPPLHMEIDIYDRHVSPQRFASPINSSVRQRAVSPLYNNRKRTTPRHFEPEDERQETDLQKDLPAAKRVQDESNSSEPYFHRGVAEAVKLDRRSLRNCNA